MVQTNNHERSVSSNGTKKEIDTFTRGDGSDQIKCHEEVTPCHRIADNETGRIEMGTNIRTEAYGDVTIHATGNIEFAADKCAGMTAPEKSQISTTPNIVLNNPMFAADEAKEEITAMRSGFGDNRNLTDPIAVKSLQSIPSDILSGITKISSDNIDSETNKGKSEFSNLFTNPWKDISSKISSYTNALKRVNADSAAAQKEANEKNKNEKLEVMKKRVEKMKDGYNKDYINEAVENKNLEQALSDASSDKKTLTSIRDTDEETNIAVKALEKEAAASANII